MNVMLLTFTVNNITDSFFMGCTRYIHTDPMKMQTHLFRYRNITQVFNGCEVRSVWVQQTSQNSLSVTLCEIQMH